MKTVQITSGGYGYREKAGSPTRLIRAGEFVCLPDDEADRLAALALRSVSRKHSRRSSRRKTPRRQSAPERAKRPPRKERRWSA